MRIRIVDTVKHAVLECNEIARRELQVALACRKQIDQRVLAVQRHQVVTQHVVRRM